MRLDAANLADFDREGRFARLGGKVVAREDEWHLVAGVEILRAADDLALALAIGDPAKGELVSIGMLVLGNDLGDDDAFEFAAELFGALHLDTEHGEPLGEFGRRPIELNVLFEPVKGCFHDGQNCFQAPFGLWYRATQSLGSFYPFLDDQVGILEGNLPGRPISRTARQLWHLGDEGLVFIAPIDDNFVLRHRFSSAILYFKIKLRTCLTWYGLASAPLG